MTIASSTSTLQMMLDYHQQVRHYPGALIHVERDGKVLARQASGMLHGYAPGEAAGADPMHEQARFRIASLTKGMVSFVALQLVDAGRLALDAPVARVLPELAGLLMADGQPPSAAPTLRQCLSHTAGFGYTREITDPVVRGQCAEVGLDGAQAGATREQFLEMLARRPLSAQPGSRFQYGFSTDVVGLMIERVTGQSLQAALQQFLFGPLDMTRTAFRVDPQLHAAMPRAFDEDTAWHDFVARFEAADRLAAQTGVSDDSLDGPMHSGGGGLVSTLDDVCAYARLIANGGNADGKALLTKALFDEAMTNQLGPTVPGPYNFTGGGFGFGLAGAIRNDWAPASYPCVTGEYCWSGVTGHTLYAQPGGGWFALMLSCNTASRVIVRFEFRRAAAGA